MPHYATANGEGTNEEAKALKSAKGVAVDNPAREVWIQETALSTGLNTSYMASQVSLFGIVVGIALLLSGFGFAILAIGGALRNPDSALKFMLPGVSARSLRARRRRRRRRRRRPERNHRERLSGCDDRSRERYQEAPRQNRPHGCERCDRDEWTSRTCWSGRPPRAGRRVAEVIPSGKTIRGVYAVQSAPGPEIGFSTISFAATLTSEPSVHYIPHGDPVPSACAGGTVSLPQAAPGNLCVFEAFHNGALPFLDNIASEEDPKSGVSGIAIGIEAREGGGTSTAFGGWAVTAP